eukprot:SAG11_NODE_37581_length_256_cov_0.662420_1_plen_63_part_10
MPPAREVTSLWVKNATLLPSYMVAVGYGAQQPINFIHVCPHALLACLSLPLPQYCSPAFHCHS